MVKYITITEDELSELESEIENMIYHNGTVNPDGENEANISSSIYALKEILTKIRKRMGE